MKQNSGNKEIKNTLHKTYLDLHQMLDAIPAPAVVVDGNLITHSANQAFYTAFQVSGTEIEQKSIFGFFAEGWSADNLKILLLKVQQGEETTGEILFPVVDPVRGRFSYLVKAIPARQEDGEILVLLTFREKNQFSSNGSNKHTNSFDNILLHAPAYICTLRGPNHVFELANNNYINLVGGRNVIGKSVKEALPEVENQGFIGMLNKVYSTGEPFVGNELPIKIDTPGEGPLNFFLNFVYQPTYDPGGEVDGIFVHAVDVTEQVVARKRVEESEQELRNIIDTVPAMIWITNRDGQSIYLNKSWYEYTGQASKAAEGFGWVDAIHPDDKKTAEEDFINANKNQKPYSCTFRLRNKNGEYRWVIDSGRSKYAVDGSYEGMMGTVVDVHEEKVKEHLIREKELRVRSIVQEATVATALYIGEEMKIELANEEMIRLWGKNATVIGKTLKEALPELNGQPFFEILRQVFTTGKTYWGKEERVDLEINGKLETGFFNFTYKPLRNEYGEIYGIINMAQNVTDIVGSKKLLKESESHYRQMADCMPDKITNANPEGEFIYYNKNWLDFSGLENEELKKKGWFSLIHPAETQAFHIAWRKSLATGTNFEMELRCLNKEKKYRWHLTRLQAVKDAAGNIKLWIGSHTDIQKLKEEEKRKEDFLKMVSHELKTPITSIKGYVQLLLSIATSQKQARVASLPIEPSLKRIDHQITRLTRLISEMLDLSRIEENKLELQKERFNLNQLVAQTVEDIHFTNTQHRIEIKNEFECEVHADKDRIGQVLINFITNAIKYSPESQNVAIVIQNAGDQKVSVSVIDKGIGINRKNHKKIFKRFYRIGGKNEETFSGFGIGLYLANEIIQRHKGTISLDSKEGEGSRFTFTLEVAPPSK